MGNYRFRLCDMMSNSWFYKLKGMGRANRSQSMQHSMKKSQTSAATTASTATLPPIHLSKHKDYLPNRASCYIPSKERTDKLPRSPVNTKASDTHFPVEPPRKSKRKTRRMATKPCTDAVSSAVSASCDCLRTATPVCKSGSMADDPTYDDDSDLCKPAIADPLEFDSFHVSSSTTDANIEVAGTSSSNRLQKFEGLEVVSELKLPPILTKPVKKEVRKSASQNTSVLKEHNKTAARRSASGLHRIKVRQNSPRVGSRKVQATKKQNTAATKVAMQQRRALSESLVMIKSSSNPWRDFMESMVEMIVENNIREPKDLEELLACYLSLNSKEYHEVIIKVFEHIWFVLTDIKM